MPIFTSIGVALGASAAAAATVGSVAVGIGATAIGTGLQIQAGRRQEKAVQRRFEATTAARRRATALQARKDNITAARQRQRAAAERRRFSGQAINLAVTRGVGGTIGAQGSTIPGVLGNLQQQFASGQLFQNQITETNRGIRTAFTEASEAGAAPLPGPSIGAAVFSAFGSLAISAGKAGLFKGFGGSGNISDTSSAGFVNDETI